MIIASRIAWRAVVGTVALCLAALHAQGQEMADKIYSGGPVITMNDAAMRAEAVGVKDGKIIAIGKADDVMKLKGAATQLIDLQGRTLIPGFFDAHGHVMAVGLQALSANLLSPPDGEDNSIAELQRILKEWAAANADAVKKVNLIFGFGYDEAQLAELRPPNRDELDAVSTDIPVYVVHQSGHIGVANSKALEILGITADTPNPPGGVIERRPGSQEPNGVLQENANFGALPKLFAHLDPNGAKELLKAGIAMEASFGYTTQTDGRSTASQVAVMKAVAEAGELPVDVISFPDVLGFRDLIEQETSRSYKNRFRIGGAKLTIDGSPQGFTAWRDRPYYKPTANYRADYVGYAAATNDQVFEAIDRAFSKGYQILTHSNGEASSDLLLAAIATAEQKYGKVDRRPVLVHGQFLREDQIDRIKALDVFPSLFPMHTFYWGDWHRDRTVGPALADNISPTGWALKRGMKFSSHHDAPVALPDSIRILSATVTRRSRSGDIIGPDQRVDPITALKAMTIWPAYQYFEENTKGSIEVGKLADLVILSEDPTAIDPESLYRIKVVETIKEGQSVYRIGDDKLPKKASRETDPVGNLLRGMALSRDAARYASYPFSKALGAADTYAPHDPGCVSGVLFGLFDASKGEAAR
ncbi:MAG: amidohydrolase [Rhizobiales bacterium]|nr:amidohydrolase [Hyphomicrobiales bacterium]